MSNQRNKLLIKLSQTNKQYYNDSSHMTNASELNQLNSEKDFEDISDFDLRDLSPIPMVPLSESLLQECILEATGEQKKEYTQLLPWQESRQYSRFEGDTSDSEDESAIAKITTVALVHSPKPGPSYQNLPIDLSVQPLKLNENRIHVISDKVIRPAYVPENKIVLAKAITPTENIEVDNSNTAPSSSSPTEIVWSPPTLRNKTIGSAVSAKPNTSQSSEADTSKQEPPKKKKRTRDPTSITQIQRDKHPLLAPCQCAKKCSEKMTQSEREEIWRQFWNMDRQRRRDFISRQVERVPTLRAKRNSRRNNTLKWSLNKVPVCKVFFLHTLGFNNDEAVQSVLKSNYAIGNKNPHVSAAPDSRGRRKPTTAFSEAYQEDMKNFILRYKPVSSHYNISHAPNRKYLPVGITFSEIFKHFKQHCVENNMKICSWPHFHEMIKKLNLSTAVQPQDICTKCRKHEEEHKNVPRPCNCDNCQDLGRHLENKRNSRRDLQAAEEICESSEGKNILFTVDMQKAICMPIIDIKDSYFSRKLVLFNESFVPPGKNKRAICVVWHEGESGRKAYNIASTFIHVLRKYCRDKKCIYFFLDNCNAQNKNKVLLSTLIRLINDESTVIDKIVLEYFEPGHTYMAADAVHAAIAKKLASSGEVYDFDDFVNKIKKSRKNLDVDVVDHSNMFLVGNDAKVQFPKGWNLQSLKVIEFRRGQISIFAKNDYNEEFKEIQFLKKKIETELSTRMKVGDTGDLFNKIQKESQPRGVNEIKKMELIELCKSMPQSRRLFYENLLVSDVQDLSTNVDSDV